MCEVWLDIKGFEGRYQISNKGKVRSLNYRKKVGRIEILCTNRVSSNLYQAVSLSKDGVITKHSVHRLLANAFIPNPQMLPEVIFRDKNNNNITIHNLKWSTTLDRVSSGKIGKSFDQRLRRPISQLTKEGKLVKRWSSARETQAHGYNPDSIGKCCRGILKTHKKCVWKFDNG